MAKSHGQIRSCMRVSVAAVAFLAALAALACGTDERLTLDQYAQFCADGVASTQSLIEPESLTWADLQELGESSAEQLRAVKPPEVLSDFHRASLKTMDFVAGIANEQPPEELANPLAFGFQALQVATQLRRTIEDLPREVRQTLSEAGCL